MKNIPIIIFLFFVFAYVNAHAQDILKSNAEMPILAWGAISSSEITIERFNEIKGAGINHCILSSSKSTVMSALNIADSTGLKLVVYYGDLKTYPDSIAAQLKEYPALAGYFLKDEPPRGDFPALADWAAKIQTVDNEHFCYVNLLPNFATTSQLGVSTYQQYVNTFINEVNIPILSFDNYPIQGDTVRTFRSGYYKNLEIFFDEAKKVGKPFWSYVPVTSMEDLNYFKPTLAELRLQVFSNLAYGAQGIEYFKYWTSGSQAANGWYAPITNGQRTELYDTVKQISREIQDLSCVFLGSKVVLVRHTGGIPQGTTRLSELPEQITVLETTDQGAIVSVLERDSLAFLAIVNRDFRNSMKLLIKGDSTVQRVQKDGVLVPSAIARLSTIEVGPGDIAAFTWPRGDSIRFKPLKGQLVNLPFDYDLKDVSGNNINGIDAGTESVSYVDDPDRGRVASFTANTHVAFADTTALHFGTEDFSFAIWVKVPATGGTPVLLSNKDFSSAEEAGFSLYLDHADAPVSKLWGISFADGSGNTLKWEASDHGGASIADGQWHSISVSFERNGMMMVCLDGTVLPGSLDMSVCPGNASDTSHNYRLAVMQDGTGTNPDQASGNVDDLRFWSRALGGEEMTQIYVSDTTDKSREIVYLPLDEDLKDASGNGYDATDVGTVATTFVTDPDRGQVAYFDRLSHAALPKVDALRLGTSDFSFSLWIKCSSASYTPLIVCNKDWSATSAIRNKGFALYTNVSNKSTGERWSVNFGDGETDDGGSSNGFRWNALDNDVPTIADDQWHFIALSFDRDKTMDVYLDGDLMSGSVDLSSLPGMAHDDVNDYPIMLMQDGRGKYWMDIPASMDEFRFWSRPLKSSEVASLYSHELVTATEEVLKTDKSTLEMQVYPNPATIVATVSFMSEDYKDATVQVYNSMGVLIKSIYVETQPGINQEMLNTAGWFPGVYLVRVTHGIQCETKKMILTH